MTKTQRYLLSGTVIVIVIVAAVMVSRMRQGKADGKTNFLEDAKMKGPANAPVQIVEFSDFQCPACRRAEAPLKKLVTQFSDVVKVAYHQFPLAMHQHAMLAAQAAECAADQKKFWPYHDLLFQHQTVWANDPSPLTILIAFANELHFDRQAFEDCLGSEEITKRIAADKAKGTAVQVRSTPTFFINGERVVGAEQLEKKGPEIIQKVLESIAGKK